MWTGLFLGISEFIQTNIVDTFNLLENVKDYWKGRNEVLFNYISTDEVYGSLGKEGFFYENTAYDPKSPYAAFMNRGETGESYNIGGNFHRNTQPIMNGRISD